MIQGNMEEGTERMHTSPLHSWSHLHKTQAKFQQAWWRGPEATPLAEDLLKVDDC